MQRAGAYQADHNYELFTAPRGERRGRWGTTGGFVGGARWLMVLFIVLQEPHVSGASILVSVPGPRCRTGVMAVR